MKRIFLLDPMLATGNSVTKAIEVLVKSGVKEERIRFLNLISVPEGIRKLNTMYPKVFVITAMIDSHLNERKYIVPGNKIQKYFQDLETLEIDIFQLKKRPIKIIFLKI